MPLHRTEYQILLSSPGDLPEERRVIAEVVSEVSSTWGGASGAVLRLLRWEDLAPAFASEPQAVINVGLGDQWDIYVGLMHARFGTATQGFGSGTEEEFRRAYELWQAAPQKRRLMFYFNKAPVDLDAIDPDQVSKVRAFKKTLGDFGGLYKEFSDASALKDIFRAHLTSVLVELHREYALATTPSPTPATIEIDAPAEKADFAPGLLDLMESCAEGMAALAPAVEGIGSVMMQATAVIEREGNNLKEASSSGDLAAMRQGITAISRSMHSMAKALAEKRREYAAASRLAFESLSTAISMAKAAWTEEVKDPQTFETTISSTMEMLEGFLASISGAERSMDSIPNLAKEFSSARLVLKREFANLKGELNTSLMLLRDLRIIAGEGERNG
jgi:hypothetical protein